MGRVVLDASVLLAVLRTEDAHHGDARSLLASHPSDTLYLVSGSVYAEVLVRAHARGRAAEVEEFLEELGVEVVPVDRDVARRAAALRAGSGPRLTLADALAVAVALGHEPPLPFATFDERLARRYQAEAEAVPNP